MGPFENVTEMMDTHTQMHIRRLQTPGQEAVMYVSGNLFGVDAPHH